ncbi:hypothetical protein TraAM80_01987 [Trypanosoma rangeli]|uniref:Uncharacterized protein n=1 Tax=Trypanosoma rangeli TaxID=5698 RepID=A0A3R7NPW9_TRYRA|nr:uncharacterized protein TraAM80_01987 [Trypanosoma rangeli]RNF09719.1 hypothetical protein TraAM80_01987 [Trypanosoma rangeli]|eukprot:RNF09719.1 hypothetical protein TraAM80_01987 [Trypanosoma rangeli]
MPQFGVLMWFYVPLASHFLPDAERDPSLKAFTTFIIGTFSGFMMRLICNPVNRVRDEYLCTGDFVSNNMQDLQKQDGALSFFFFFLHYVPAALQCRLFWDAYDRF